MHTSVALLGELTRLLGACTGTTASDGADTAQSRTSNGENWPITSQPPTNTDATARLTRAAAGSGLDGVKQAMADNADLESRDQDGRTPLVAATKADR
ncbi:hypothetical protein [Micromonospora sp. CB01531]|uniref:hypothetical protein n=1 Tax=Micromonospora sp. CB01531 TaxID=1718947 RepID=UPI00093CCC0D|nr:hypothetical protein [Micromonospora sp. CB01531]OKI65576.1 hypothetical protein A6A27_24705 [Micromonospora sp. CB01531]